MAFRLDGYLARIGWSGPLDPTLATLTALLGAHMARIPFENLDVLLGRGIRIDAESVYAKLVTAGRGGYCYEHSTLLRTALERIGFAPVAHSARVVMVVPRSAAPRTHMFLTVPLAGETLVLDPGFGGHGPIVPVPLVEDRDARDGSDVHRMTRRDGEWVLEARIGGDMTPLWMSTLEVESPIDFVMANHFTATWADSPFVNRLMLRALTAAGRVTVMNRDVTLSSGGTLERTQLADRAALRTLLARSFSIDLPDVERLRIPSVPEWG